jgi:hypothetical protein
MKRTVQTAASLVTLLLLVPFALPGKKRGPADELLRAINRSPLGITITCPRKNIVTHPEGTRTRITLQNPVYTFDPSTLMKTTFRTDTQPARIPITIREITYLFDSREKFAELVSMEGLDLSMTNCREMGPVRLEVASTVHMAVDRIDYRHMLLSPLLTCSGRDRLELFRALAAGMQDQAILAKNIRYDIQNGIPGKGPVSVSFTIGQAEITSSLDPDFILGFYSPVPLRPIFEKSLQSGSSLFHSQAALSDVGFSVGYPGGKSNGTLIQGKIAYFLEPDAARTSFLLGTESQLQELHLQLPSHPQLSKLLQFQEIGIRISLEALTMDLIQTLLDSLRTSPGLEQPGNGPEQAAAVKRAKELIEAKAAAEFAKSKSSFILSLDPVRLPIGEFSLHAAIQFSSSPAPAALVRIQIHQVDDIMRRLGTEYGVPLETLIGARLALAQFLIIDEKGDGAMTLEMKPELPGQYLLNGKPAAFPFQQSNKAE